MSDFLASMIERDIQHKLDVAQSQGALTLIVEFSTGEKRVYDVPSRRLISDEEYPTYKRLLIEQETNNTMTDNHNTSIITIDDALSGLADGTQTIQDIGAYLGGMWQHAIDSGDETAVSYYQAAWDLANVLATSNEQAKGIIQTFGAQRDEAAAQRDAVTNAYASYQEAVINMDTEHPEAGRHIKLVHSAGKLKGHDEGYEQGYGEGEEAGYDGAHEEAYTSALESFEILTNDPGESLMNGIFSDFPYEDKARWGVVYEQASDFVFMLFSDDLEQYEKPLRDKVLAFIQQIHPEILASKDRYTQAQTERTERWNAEFEARRAAMQTDHITENGDNYDDDENTDPDA